MGNQSGRELETKIFDTVKPIPLVGWGYRAVRLGACVITDDKEKAMKCMEFDLAEEINPIKKIGNVTRGVTKFLCSHDKGVWVGRRSLSGLTVPGLGASVQTSFSPGNDVSHWAIMCDGVIYQTTGGQGGTQRKNCSGTFKSSIIAQNVMDWTTSQTERDTFTWTFISDFCYASRSQLEAIAKRGFGKYGTITAPGAKGTNCQIAVAALLETALNLSEAKVAAILF
eukprot:369063_1